MSSESERRTLLVTTVDIGEGRSDKVHLREGDSPLVSSPLSLFLSVHPTNSAQTHLKVQVGISCDAHHLKISENMGAILIREFTRCLFLACASGLDRVNNVALYLSKSLWSHFSACMSSRSRLSSPEEAPSRLDEAAVSNACIRIVGVKWGGGGDQVPCQRADRCKEALESMKAWIQSGLMAYDAFEPFPIAAGSALLLRPQLLPDADCRR